LLGIVFPEISPESEALQQVDGIDCWSGVSFPCDLSDPWLSRFAFLSPLYGFLPQLRQSTPTVLQGFAGCFYQGRIFITR
jgi:hypothetical protein